MQIVPKWHGRARLGGSTSSHGRALDRVAPISAVRRASKDDAAPDHAQAGTASSARSSLRFSGNTLIATQVVVSRTLSAIDAGYDQSTLLAGNSAYSAALERKVHHLEGGSFYRDQA